MYAMRTGHEKEMRCLSEIIMIGSIDSLTIGCLASQVVLYASVSACGPAPVAVVDARPRD